MRHMCTRCNLWSWNGQELADKRTHDARKAAHLAFDRLWKEKTISRNEAYYRLAKHLGINPLDCHMVLMTAEIAERVPEIVEAIYFEMQKPPDGSQEVLCSDSMQEGPPG